MGSNTYNAGNANSRLHFDNGILYLNYTGGDYCHHAKKTRETIISFVCNSSHVNTEYGEPVFIAETADCTYHIMWHTQLVCERQVQYTLHSNKLYELFYAVNVETKYQRDIYDSGEYFRYNNYSPEYLNTGAN